MNQLEQRLFKLERSVKLYRYFFGLSVIAAVSIVLMSHKAQQTVPDLVQAKEFQVVDNFGNVVASIKKEDGGGKITTFSSNGKKLVSLITTNGGGGGLSTYDEDENLIFKVTKTEGGGGYMTIFNKNGYEIAEMGATTDQAGYVRTNDKYAKTLGLISNTDGGGGYLSLSSGDQQVIRLSTNSSGGRVGVYNGNNKRIAYMGSQDDNTGNMTVYNNNGDVLGSMPK